MTGDLGRPWYNLHSLSRGRTAAPRQALGLRGGEFELRSPTGLDGDSDIAVWFCRPVRETVVRYLLSFPHTCGTFPAGATTPATPQLVDSAASNRFEPTLDRLSTARFSRRLMLRPPRAIYRASSPHAGYSLPDEDARRSKTRPMSPTLTLVQHGTQQYTTDEARTKQTQVRWNPSLLCSLLAGPEKPADSRRR